MSTNLTRIGQKARGEPDLVFTSLYHHVVDVDNLRACYGQSEGLTEVPDVWEIRLSGCRDRGTTEGMAEILWHRRETRRQTEKTNVSRSHGRPRSTRHKSNFS